MPLRAIGWNTLLFRQKRLPSAGIEDAVAFRSWGLVPLCSMVPRVL